MTSLQKRIAKSPYLIRTQALLRRRGIKHIAIFFSFAKHTHTCDSNAHLFVGAFVGGGVVARLASEEPLDVAAVVVV